jgi:hypothetical protein
MHAAAPGNGWPESATTASPPDPAGLITQQFPGWRAWASQTGRWWAKHDGVLTAGQADAGCQFLLHGYSPEELAGRVREQETLRQHADEAATSRWLDVPTAPGRRPGRNWQQ